MFWHALCIVYCVAAYKATAKQKQRENTMEKTIFTALVVMAASLVALLASMAMGAFAPLASMIVFKFALLTFLGALAFTALFVTIAQAFDI